MFVVVRAKRGFVMWVRMVCLGQMEALVLVVAIVAVLMDVSMFVAVRVAMRM